ncbi:MAG: nucleoside triphosphate pyrophosphohydrolase [Acidobacteria bacterium]|jgi:MazG family protein|nr:nucleoside triphosphate pyrophosphohydrolase [Acidobacteriota bacterium]
MSDATDRLVEIMDRLRDPGGCPWDREQTLESLTGYLLEEAHEVVGAVASGEPELLCEELGDLLLQIIFMARIARENSWFDFDAVCDAISDKMIRRHPHVFGTVDVAGADEVARNWEDIKQEERKEQPEASALDGIPAALPGLLKAFRMTEKAAALGFDWQRPTDVVGKLHEEVEELESALLAGSGNGSPPVREELGDILFVMANLARHLGVEPETALQGTNSKFMSRFRSMEDQARAAGRSLRSYDLQELDALWQEAKRLERG